MFTVICVYKSSYKIYDFSDLMDAMELVGDNFNEDMIEGNIYCDGILILHTILKTN